MATAGEQPGPELEQAHPGRRVITETEPHRHVHEADEHAAGQQQAAAAEQELQNPDHPPAARTQE